MVFSPRGLVELRILQNNCYYCGIQRQQSECKSLPSVKRGNPSACENGYQLGYRSFVLQGGEDPHYTDEVMVPIVQRSESATLIVPSHFLLGNAPKKVIKNYMMQVLIVICFDMKLLTQSFTRNSTQKVFL